MLPDNPIPGTLRRAAAGLAILLATAVTAHAGGPRFVTGTAFGAIGPGGLMAFYTPQLTYFTDPGDLASTVPHAQADAMIAAAAAVWNNPYASVTLSQGGVLAEHVSSANAYFNGTQMVFPADVSASNYATIPIAVLYDSDGSVTDQLLGSGASNPTGCRQNGVISTVDSFSATGRILHAILIVNGRCAGPAPQQLTQLEYQAMRAFGRILGLAWSQVNDNVFTGLPAPSGGDMSYWPVMHPIDIVCGPYTYQCMQNPFTLRVDDVSALALLYPVATTNAATGKIASLSDGVSVNGEVYFPTITGMEMVNVTVKRLYAGTSFTDASQVLSGVTGAIYQANGGTRVSGGESAALNQGFWGGVQEGEFFLGRVPMDALCSLWLGTESINPLYTGSNSLGIFQRPAPVISGGNSSYLATFLEPGANYYTYQEQFGGASACAPGNDGVENAPVAAPASGIWTGQICGLGHQSWFTVAVKPGSTWTLETTALDDNGYATLQKVQPVIGVWHSSDAPYASLPTVARAAFAMNSLAAGVTQLRMPSASTSSSYRVVIQDQFGAGRPDFNYQARILYAASVSPASVGSGGGLITLTGTGFVTGNQVLVNGVAATVLSTSATQIQAIAPSLARSGASLATPVAVEVLDTHTGGSTTIASALSYTSAPDLVQLVSAPAALLTGVAATTPFVVKVLTSDGLAPAIGATVTFTVTHGSATLACGSATCNIITDATGQASTTVLGLAAGSVTITATETSGGNSVSMTAADTDPVYSLTLTQPTAYLAAGASATWTLTALATLNSAPATALPVAWTVTGNSGLTPLASTTDSTGSVSATFALTSAAVGSYSVQACAWSSVCSSWTVHVVAASQWLPILTSGAGQSIPQSSRFAPVAVAITDGAGHTLPGATATVHQEVEAWEGPCPANGPCPAAPVLATSTGTLTADASGNITITPLTVPAQPEVTSIAIVTGTQGFVTLTLVKTP